jgi:two-component system, NtrC family, nitrogen regulation sensor histidine kinase NtrY
LLIISCYLLSIDRIHPLPEKNHEELNEFVEAIHYRDFSKYFDVKHAPADIQPLRKGFNEINTTFKVISKEKEAQ